MKTWLIEWSVCRRVRIQANTEEEAYEKFHDEEPDGEWVNDNVHNITEVK